MKIANNDTICAPATGNGVGAITVIRVSGEDAIQLTGKIFSKKLETVSSHTVHFGAIRNEDNEVVDEVVVTVFKDKKSYTGENTTEISCHGSSFIQREVIRLLLKNGCRMAQPGEFTMRAYFNGKMDLSQAEAVADLIASDSKKSHDVAINQMRGGYSEHIQLLRQRLMDFASLIELELDFGEEDVEFASRDDLKALVGELKERLGKLTDSFAYGNAIKNGINTVIAGRPNAGKSTLLNALLNEERAIVSSIPGTTRDTIEERVVIEGMVYNFIDTAGIREATDEIEKIGVERTFNEVKRSNILLYVFDAKETTPQEVQSDLSSLLQENTLPLILANKTENIPTFDRDKFEFDVPLIAISAKEHIGLDEIKTQLADFALQLSSESDTVVVNARHYEAFKKALEDIERVEEGIASDLPGDLLAMDIRSSIRHLAEITGEITTDDLLGNIFANFCIGK